jgi:solute carrier family 25 protein 34/35
MDFAIGGAAAVCAGFFTNPLEVMKTRMQLQGELLSRGQHAVHYKNVFHAGYVIAKHDGILALQAGLVPGLWFQLVLNGYRFGLYQILDDKGYMKDKKGNLVFYKSVLIGGFAGASGAFIASPFYLIKTHLQSQASKEIAFGHQYHYKGTWSGLWGVFKEQGVKGLFRGGSSAVPRAFVGSTSQLTSFAYCKEFMRKYDILTNSPLLMTFTASMVGGVAISLMMTPFDLVSTRLYNQGVDQFGKGLLYNGYTDCVLKIWKTEGFLGFYKGLGPSYFRLGPHTVLCLVFWDEFKELYSRIKPSNKF